MGTNVGAKITTVGVFTLSAMLPYNDYINAPKMPTVPYFHSLSVTSSTGIDEEYRFDYVEESLSLRDISNLLIEDSRGFTQREADDYSSFIESFFS